MTDKPIDLRVHKKTESATAPSSKWLLRLYVAGTTVHNSSSRIFALIMQTNTRLFSHKVLRRFYCHSPQQIYRKG